MSNSRNEPQETIVAQATAPGRGSIGVLRISGPACRNICLQILGVLPRARDARYLPFLDAEGGAIDQGIAIFYRAPHSFTGEDVLELQGHGGAVVLDMLMQRVLQLGTRAARPGEFSERAFLNHKLDLVQAEAVAALIDSDSEQAARAAMQSLQGTFSNHIHALVDLLTGLRVFVESAIDFPEEDIDFIAQGEVSAHLQYIRDNISQIQATAQQGRLQQEGMTVVIAGSPNVGKSSLMNALAERETAIVTDVPGTTRDVLRERIQIDGLPLHLIDTAGLHETADAVEKEGIRRAREAMADADHTLLLVDDSADFALEGQGTPDLAAELAGNPNVTRVYNKIDLSGRESGLGEHQGKTHIGISARSGAGIDALRGYLKTCVGYRAGTEGVFMARRRHLQALDDASACLQRADKALTATTPELLADDLRQAQIALGRITGDVSSDDLLGEIFSSFCIGK